VSPRHPPPPEAAFAPLFSKVDKVDQVDKVDKVDKYEKN